MSGQATVSVWDRIMALSDVGIATWAVITYIFLYLPVVVLVLFSFTSDQFNLKFTHPTLEWYRSQPQASTKVIGVIHDPTIIKAFETSIEIAIFSTIIAVIIGGLGSLWGTLVGGVVLGIAQVLGDHAHQGWGMLVGHLVFLAILAFRPQGLFARQAQ